MLTHFDADAVLVPRTIVIGMVALLVRRHVLDSDAVLHGEMPNYPAQRSILKRPRMRIGVTRVVLGAVDRNVTRPH